MSAMAGGTINSPDTPRRASVRAMDTARGPQLPRSSISPEKSESSWGPASPSHADSPPPPQPPAAFNLPFGGGATMTSVPPGRGAGTSTFLAAAASHQREAGETHKLTREVPFCSKTKLERGG